MKCPRCDREMTLHRRKAPSRGPFRTGDTQAVLLACSECDLTVASEDARRSRGYRPLEAEPFGSVRERREAFLAEAGQFEAAMLERHEKARSDDPTRQVNWDALAERIDACRAAGVEVVLVVPPGPWAPPSSLGVTTLR